MCYNIHNLDWAASRSWEVRYNQKTRKEVLSMSDNELLGMAKIAKSNQIKAEAKRAKEEKEYLEKEKTDQ